MHEVAGSYRDPRGRVHRLGERVLRVVAAESAARVRAMLESPVVRRLMADGRLVGTRPLPDGDIAGSQPPGALVLEHERIPFVSHPYEWPFAALRAAAVLQLDLHLDLLREGYTLRDASAYNIQFRGTRPTFIDLLSIDRYEEGEYWSGHRQFCDQFLCPLLFSARFGIPYHAWYRGGLEGIAAPSFVRLLRVRDCLSPRTLVNLVLPAWLESRARRDPTQVPPRSRLRPLPRQSLMRMLEGMRAWVLSLSPRDQRTNWTGYAQDNTYGAGERDAKRAFVASAVSARPRALVLDLGCNTGDYADVALSAGATRVVGAEADPETADLAFARSRSAGLDFLPLVLDAVNASPAQGWRDAERESFAQRARFDFLIALAVIHHIVIGRNVPIAQAVRRLVDLAPEGVIEFVHKDDTTVRRMLALRDDVFPDYTQAHFQAALESHARIVDQRTVSSEGRTLFHYRRAPAS